MNFGRFVVRAAVAYFAGSLATLILFFLIAWPMGELQAGIHSHAAIVFILQPVAWIVAFILLRRAGFPPSLTDSQADKEKRRQ